VPWLAPGDDANAHAGRRRCTAAPRRADVAVGGRGHLVGGGEVDPELEARHAAFLLLGISEWMMPRPAVIHWTLPGSSRPTLPTLSRWRMRPSSMIVTVSKPRCGMVGKPPT
jgi:hypothetical protein